ncbi:hypothetical protein K438DRAFT_1813760 [Mycena galopus ATCC 62051]|nr:hypothetical protein K438DRAFT_1813760 [Mycena galopus ATCC 62051]
MDPWIQSLSAPSSRLIGLRRDSNTRLLAPAPSMTKVPATCIPASTKSCLAPAPEMNAGSNTRRLASALPATKGPVTCTSTSTHTRLELALDTNAAYPLNKCPNLCCDDVLEQPATFAQSRSEAGVESHLTYCDSSETARIMDEISLAQTLHTSYEKELTRLKCMLAARPPLGYEATVLASGKSKSCMRACCTAGFNPSHGASPRLLHVTQQLQLRCREISQNLSANRRLLAPIRCLPPELLEEVFLFAVISEIYALSAASNHHSPASLPKAVNAIRLAHVCSYWRAVALDTGRLWATILLRLTGTGINQLDFNTSHAKSTPLTIICHEWAAPQTLAKLARQSHRWRDLTLRVDSDLEEFDGIYQRIPLLRSLCLRLSSRRIITVFRDAPSLRRVVLTSDFTFPEPFSFILPWTHLTFLTLAPLPFSLFSECLRQCPRLLYFKVDISWQKPAEPPQVAETHGSLRKLVVHGAHCQAVILAHNFPHLLSLSIEMDAPDPRFFAFLAQSSRLEMLSMSGQDFHTREVLAGYCSRPPPELVLATPSLRIMHLRNSSRRKTAMVTPRFYTPLVTPPRPDVPFPSVAPRSLTVLDVEECTALEDVTLLEFIKARMERDPSFDPYGIEKARLQIASIPFDPEAEMDYLNYIS